MRLRPQRAAAGRREGAAGWGAPSPVLRPVTRHREQLSSTARALSPRPGRRGRVHRPRLLLWGRLSSFSFREARRPAFSSPETCGFPFTAALHPRDPARAPPLCLCLITGDHSPPLQPFPSVCQKRWDIASACLSSAHSLPQDSTHEGPWGAAGSFLSAVPMTAQEPHSSCALLGDVSRLWVTRVPGPPGRLPAAPALRGRMWVA